MIEESIKKSLETALNTLEVSNQVIELTKPQKKENGDFATNIALKLAKTLQDNPLNIANKIKENFKCDLVTTIEVAPPGFINFFVKKDYLLDNINTIIKEGTKYGSNTSGKGLNYNIEFVSANPTGILHLGNARGGAYGDSLARILRFSGYDVTEEYYVNDAGVQITNLGLSIQARYLTLLGIPTEIPENGYHGPEITEIAKDLYQEHKDTLKDQTLDYYKELGTNILLAKIKKVLQDYRINFDVYSSEKEIVSKSNLPKMIKTMQDNGYAYESDGATWLKSSVLGDDKDHVLIKNDGSYTYLVPDIAYHIDKIKRGYTNLIDVLGTDHHGYVARLKGSLKALGYNPDILDVKLLQLVRLVKDGIEIKMSKRTGNSVSLQELIDEVGINAARYFFSMRSLDTQMDFDLELAKKTSNENPVYYVSYAYARTCTILNSYKNIKNINKYLYINDILSYNVLEKLYEFPSVVKNAAEKKLPHLITNYVYDLASSFHLLYSKKRFITDNEDETMENLNFLSAIKITIKNALDLIGVIPPEKM